MSLDYTNDFSPQQAWSPLPGTEWNAGNARHLLRRIGFTATPSGISDALASGLSTTLEKYFGQKRHMPEPPKAMAFGKESAKNFRQLRNASDQERQAARRELRQDSNDSYLDYGIKWLLHAHNPAGSPYEKLVMFLQDVFVVGLPKVRNPYFLYLHQALLREFATEDFDQLCKMVSRSPAMIQYLDLQQNVQGKPNENFARELFELFMLGEGNYAEQDIKEAARAFTGYKTDGSKFRFIPRQHDGGVKKVFGKRGAFTGDDIIDLALKQPAASTFLPREFLRYYLSTELDLGKPYMDELGRQWRKNSFNLGSLVKTVFSSRLFFHEQFHGNMIKSPIQFYLGLLQDLNLDVAPFPTATLNNLRNMGQPFYAPPNVRGWLGGQLWINSATLAARRQTVESLFAPVDEDAMNADDYAELMVARLENRGRLVVNDENIKRVAGMEDNLMVAHLIEYLIPSQAGPEFKNKLTHYLKNSAGFREDRTKNIVVTLLQSPQYNLC